MVELSSRYSDEQATKNLVTTNSAMFCLAYSVFLGSGLTMGEEQKVRPRRGDRIRCAWMGAQDSQELVLCWMMGKGTADRYVHRAQLDQCLMGWQG